MQIASLFWISCQKKGILIDNKLTFGRQSLCVQTSTQYVNSKVLLICAFYERLFERVGGGGMQKPSFKNNRWHFVLQNALDEKAQKLLIREKLPMITKM